MVCRIDPSVLFFKTGAIILQVLCRMCISGINSQATIVSTATYTCIMQFHRGIQFFKVLLCLLCSQSNGLPEWKLINFKQSNTWKVFFSSILHICPSVQVDQFIEALSCQCLMDVAYLWNLRVQQKSRNQSCCFYCGICLPIPSAVNIYVPYQEYAGFFLGIDGQMKKKKKKDLTPNR